MKKGLVPCKNDLMARLEALQELKGKVFYIESPEKLQEQAKLMTPPYAGVLYSMTEVAPDAQKGGHSHNLVFMVYATGQSLSWGGYDSKDGTIDVLDNIFDAVVDKISPSGHKWRFTGQQAAGTLNGVLVYEQTWKVHNIA